MFQTLFPHSMIPGCHFPRSRHYRYYHIVEFRCHFYVRHCILCYINDWFELFVIFIFWQSCAPFHCSFSHFFVGQQYHLMMPTLAFLFFRPEIILMKLFFAWENSTLLASCIFRKRILNFPWCEIIGHPFYQSLNRFLQGRGKRLSIYVNAVCVSCFLFTVGCTFSRDNAMQLSKFIFL